MRNHSGDPMKKLALFLLFLFSTIGLHANEFEITQKCKTNLIEANYADWFVDHKCNSLSLERRMPVSSCVLELYNAGYNPQYVISRCQINQDPDGFSACVITLYTKGRYTRQYSINRCMHNIRLQTEFKKLHN
jgi:hypothetical protein